MAQTLHRRTADDGGASAAGDAPDRPDRPDRAGDGGGDGGGDAGDAGDMLVPAHEAPAPLATRWREFRDFMFRLTPDDTPDARTLFTTRLAVGNRIWRDTSLGAFVAGPAYAFAVRQTADFGLVLLGIAMVIVGSALGYAVIHRTRPFRARPQAMRWMLVARVALALFLSLGWSLATFGPAISGDITIALPAIILQVALISIGSHLYIHLPIACVLFSGPVAATFILSVILNPTGIDPIAAGLAIVYFVIIVQNAVTQGLRYGQGLRAATRLSLAEKRRMEQDHALAVIRTEEVRREAERRARLADRERAEALRRTEDMMALARAFEENVADVVAHVSGSIGALARTASGLDDMGQTAVREAGGVARSAEETSAVMRAIAASVDELSLSIGEISAKVSDHAAVSDKAQTLATTSARAMTTVTDEARHVHGVVELIGRIATRTNLLALNATIEASRAGDAGRGFAVVAAEVRNLANQTRSATGDIAGQIGIMRGEVEAASDRISDTRQQIDAVADIAAAIAGAMAQQRDTTADISAHTAQVAASADMVSAHMTRLSERISEAGRLSHALTETVATLEAQSAKLRDGTSTFLAQLRAA